MSSYEIVIIIIIIYCFTTQEVKGVMGLMSDICVGGLKAKASSHTKQTNKRTEQNKNSLFISELHRDRHFRALVTWT